MHNLVYMYEINMQKICIIINMYENGKDNFGRRNKKKTHFYTMPM